MKGSFGNARSYRSVPYDQTRPGLARVVCRTSKQICTRISTPVSTVRESCCQSQPHALFIVSVVHNRVLHHIRQSSIRVLWSCIYCLDDVEAPVVTEMGASIIVRMLWTPKKKHCTLNISKIALGSISPKVCVWRLARCESVSAWLHTKTCAIKEMCVKISLS